MKTRAAVAWEAGKPSVDRRSRSRQGRKKGEVLVRLVATGVCHTDAYTLSGADPEGAVPGHPRPRGRRHRRGGRPGREERQARRSRDPAVHARVRAVQVLQIRQDESVRGDSRDAGQGPDAGRHEPLLARTASRSCTSWARRTFSEYTVLPEIARREDQQEGAAREGLPARLRHHDRHRRRAPHGQGEAGLDRRRVRLGRRRLERASKAR